MWFNLLSKDSFNIFNFGESGEWKVWEVSLWPGGHWFKHQISKDWEGKDWTRGGGEEADRGAAPQPTLVDNATVGPWVRPLPPSNAPWVLNAGCPLFLYAPSLCVHVWWDKCRDRISFKVWKVSIFAPTVGPPAGRNRHGAKLEHF